MIDLDKPNTFVLRDGRTVGPFNKGVDGSYYEACYPAKITGLGWYPDGTFLGPALESPLDIVGIQLPVTNVTIPTIEDRSQYFEFDDSDKAEYHPARITLTKDQSGTLVLVRRYYVLLQEKGYRPVQDVEGSQTGIEHIMWMLERLLIEIGTNPKFDDGKCGRWIGFIQYRLIYDGYLTVKGERDYFRPLFTEEK